MLIVSRLALSESNWHKFDPILPNLHQLLFYLSFVIFLIWDIVTFGTLISLLVSSSDFYLDLLFNHCLPNSTKISTTSEMICWGQLSSKVTDINFMQFTKTASAAVLKTTQLVGNCNCRMQRNLPKVMPRKLRFPTDFNIHSFKIHFIAGGGYSSLWILRPI